MRYLPGERENGIALRFDALLADIMDSAQSLLPEEELKAFLSYDFPGKERLRRGNLREVKFYRKLPGGEVQCGVCPLECVLSPGETSECRTKHNHDGRLLTHAYNNPCILRVSTVLRKPRNYPGQRSSAS